MNAPKAKMKLQFPSLPVWAWATIGAVVLGAVGALVYSLPSHASWRYGACKVFLERYVKFPSTIDIKTGREMRSMVELAFADTNPYGSQQIREFECYFSENAQGRVTLSKITLDRKTIPDEYIKSFNDLIPLLTSIDTDTELPRDLPSSLSDLKD